MRIIDNPLDQDHSLNSWISLISLFLLVFGGTIILGFMISAVLLPLFGHNVSGLLESMQEGIDPSLQTALMVFQGAASVGGFILAPIIFLYLVAKIRPVELLRTGGMDAQGIILTAILVIVFMVINAPIIEWNANLKFPAFLSEFETMATDKELELAELTRIMTTFEALPEFILGMIVIAVIPAFGEEFLFRGLIQNYLLRITKNHHLAIWIAAIIFGVFHMQFYGVFPRILLGALFGYLYVWTGSLWIAIAAHFVNNGFTLLMSYLYQRGGVGYDIQDTSVPPLYMVILALIIFTGLVIFFRKRYFLDIKDEVA